MGIVSSRRSEENTCPNTVAKDAIRVVEIRGRGHCSLIPGNPASESAWVLRLPSEFTMSRPWSVSGSGPPGGIGDASIPLVRGHSDDWQGFHHITPRRDRNDNRYASRMRSGRPGDRKGAGH